MYNNDIKNNKDNIMEKLKELRKERRLKQADVARALNISVQVYCNYENSLREPSQETLIKLADFFGVSVDYLLGRESTTIDADTFDIAFYASKGITDEEKREEAEKFLDYLKNRK